MTLYLLSFVALVCSPSLALDCAADSSSDCQATASRMLQPGRAMMQVDSSSLKNEVLEREDELAMISKAETGQVCATWCANSPRGWDAKCFWGACDQCPECVTPAPPTPAPTDASTDAPTDAPTEQPTEALCESHCAGNTSSWESKCTWDRCAGCSICATTCLAWCETNTGTWETKCKSTHDCHNCDRCSQSSLAPTESPTVSPTETEQNGNLLGVKTC